MVFIIRTIIPQKEKIDGFDLFLFMRIDQKIVTVKWIFLLIKNDPKPLCHLENTPVRHQSRKCSYKPFEFVFKRVINIDAREERVRALFKPKRWKSASKNFL